MEPTTNQLPPRPQPAHIRFADFVLTLDSVAGAFDRPVQLRGYAKLPLLVGSDGFVAADLKEMPPSSGFEHSIIDNAGDWEAWKRAQQGQELKTQAEKLEQIAEALIHAAEQKVKARAK